MKNILSLPLLLFLPAISFAQVSVLTHHNDNMRTGLNPDESILNISNVDTLHFGKLCERPVDDEVYAQPLVVSNVDIPASGTHNVLYIATVNNSVYAYDADERMIVNPYWTVNLTPPGSRVIRASDYSQVGACGGDYRDFSGNIGIVSTPCIDTASNTIYVVSKNKVTLSGEYQQWLHALDLRDGSEKANSPKLIEASLPGHGYNNINGVMIFDPFFHNQRASLLLSNNVVYITWAGYCDMFPFHGWILGYDAQTLDRIVTYNAAVDGIAAGIWMSGGGISTDDSGYLYACTGNGTVGDSGNTTDLSNRGQSILKLERVGNTLEVRSYFTPHNWQFLNDIDADLGTCAVMLVPGTDMALTAGKEGILYVADKDSMGGVDTVDHVRQKINVSTLCSGGTTYWESDSGDYVYIWPSVEQPLLRFTIDHASGTLDTLSLMESTMTEDFIPGGILSVSSNGSQVGSGIVWACVPLDWATPGVPNRPSILRAFDASDITHELWNSQMNPARDSITNFPKFVPPTIANGRVYMATFSGKVLMYGIFNPDGVDEISNEEPSIFPNPFHDKLNVQMGKNSKETILTVFNTLGENVYERDLGQDSFSQLDLSFLTKGIYFVNIQTEDKSCTSKVIKTQ
jgi:hypothetical protein